MVDEIRHKKGKNYGLYLIIGIIMWLAGLAIFEPIVSLRESTIGEILFVGWWVYMLLGWIIFAIGCIKRFKYKYYL